MTAESLCIGKIKEELLVLINSGGRIFKFLDRTFNVNSKRFLKICKILENTKNNYQFEIAAELFDEEVIDYFINEVTPNKFRLEIGVQSLMSKAVSSVNRRQDSNKLIEVINKINQAGRVVIHVDLIAGLPYETLSIFKNMMRCKGWLAKMT